MTRPEQIPEGRQEPEGETSRIGALERLYRSLDQALVRYFNRRTRDRSEADDLAHEVFLRIAVRGDTHRLKNPAAYIFETATNVLRDRLRRRSVRRADEHECFDADVHGDSDFSSERLLLGKEALDEALLNLMMLPERTRTIFVLRRLEGYSYKDIAQRLQISVSAVEKHMARAIEHLTAGGDES